MDKSLPEDVLLRLFSQIDAGKNGHHASHPERRPSPWKRRAFQRCRTLAAHIFRPTRLMKGKWKLLPVPPYRRECNNISPWYWTTSQDFARTAI